MTRDITALFRAVVAGGMSQRRLAELVHMSQSEVSEIMAGRRVSSYAALLRVAKGLGIERGIMGLAYTDEPGQDHETDAEIDDDVLRRQLLSLGSWALFGKAVLGEPGTLPAAKGNTPLPQRIGQDDVAQVVAVTERLRALDLTYGGGGIYAAADQTPSWRQNQLSSLAGAVQLASGQLEKAATTLTGLLRQAAAGPSRTVAVDLTRLATIYLRIGEIDRGVTTGRHALNAVAAVPGSVRLKQRLAPLKQEAASRPNPSCQALARIVHTHLAGGAARPAAPQT